MRIQIYYATGSNFPTIQSGTRRCGSHELNRMDRATTTFF
jgi:hypothetical protein